MVMMQTKKHLIIGNGQSAFHLSEYFKQLSIIFDQWSRKTHPEKELLEKINNTDVVYILIKDDALINFYNRYPFLKEKICFHFSGAIPSFDHCISTHPLMSFASRKPFTLDFYKSIPFVTDHSDLPVLFPLPNSIQKISPADKKLYHALCVISGNFTVILWSLAKKYFSEINLDPKVLNPYLNQIAKQLTENADQALSGPFVRKDFQTIAAHIASIQGTELEPIYQGFLKSYFSGKDLEQFPPFRYFEKNEDLC